MSLFGRAVRLADRAFPRTSAHAHCDVPCGIYHPHDALQAADTVISMVAKLKDLEKAGMNDSAAWNTFTRMVVTKEEHAEKAKKETLILWTDYFTPEHLEKFPNLHDLVWQACKLGSYNKRNIDEASANELKAAIQKIGDIFWETKK